MKNVNQNLKTEAQNQVKAPRNKFDNHENQNKDNLNPDKTKKEQVMYETKDGLKTELKTDKQ